MSRLIPEDADEPTFASVGVIDKKPGLIAGLFPDDPGPVPPFLLLAKIPVTPADELVPFLPAVGRREDADEPIPRP